MKIGFRDKNMPVQGIEGFEIEVETTTIREQQQYAFENI